MFSLMMELLLSNPSLNHWSIRIDLRSLVSGLLSGACCSSRETWWPVWPVTALEHTIRWSGEWGFTERRPPTANKEKSQETSSDGCLAPKEHEKIDTFLLLKSQVPWQHTALSEPNTHFYPASLAAWFTQIASHQHHQTQPTMTWC